MINNRVHFQPDYIFAIVQKPSGWRPKNYYDIPATGKIVAADYVASYAEAHDDLVRCNRISLSQALDTWAVIRVANV